MQSTLFGKEILKLDDPYLQYIKRLITTYFLSGKYSDKLLFDETYKDYMERKIQEWLGL